MEFIDAVRIPAEANFIIFFQSVQNDSGAQPAYESMRTRISSPGAKAARTYTLEPVSS